jgi:hypothetical protein
MLAFNKRYQQHYIINFKNNITIKSNKACTSFLQNISLIIISKSFCSMKTLFSFITLLILVINANAQLNVTLVPSNYHGSNISCHGAANGSVSAVATDGTSPYTYEWSNSVTTQSINGLSAGSYTVTVTDANSETSVASITLYAPSALSVTLSANNVTIHGTNTGSITTEVSGGTTPYQYLWSNDSTSSDISDLPTGNYTVTVTDVNGCTTVESASLTQPDQLQVSITVLSEVTCLGINEGALTYAVEGGVPPYQAMWSTGAEGDTLDSLSPGSYRITVTDANDARAGDGKYLQEQSPFSVKPEISVYPASGTENKPETTLNSLNYEQYGVSCYGCKDGWITVDVPDTGSYTYEWDTTHINGMPFKDGINFVGSKNDADEFELHWFTGSQTLDSLAPGYYLLQVTNNSTGCIARDIVYLKPQDRDNWSVFGNKNLHPDYQFIGSTDSSDLSFRTFNEERVSIMANGDFRINNLADTDTIQRTVYVDMNGNLFAAPRASTGCYNGHWMPAEWYQSTVPTSDNIWRICGKVGVGFSTPTGKFEVKENAGGLNTLEIMANPNSSTTVVPRHRGMTLGYDGSSTHDGSFNFWIDPAQNDGQSSAFNFKGIGVSGEPFMTINKDGQVGIGTTHFEDLTSTNPSYPYLLYVKGGIMTERVRVAEDRGVAWPDYVFDNNYSLTSLADLEKYIVANNHLPEMPSASDVKSSGIDVSSMLNLQMKKIEELTLYVIKLEKEVNALKSSK